jgi:hypothetical protein
LCESFMPLVPLCLTEINGAVNWSAPSGCATHRYRNGGRCTPFGDVRPA